MCTLTAQEETYFWNLTFKTKKFRNKPCISFKELEAEVFCSTVRNQVFRKGISGIIVDRYKNMGLLELLITASVPVFNMLLMTGVGSFLATNYAGILVKEARIHLNNVVFYVFNPCLVVNNLAQTITMESMAKLWFMPINILLTFIFGLIFGWVVIRVTRPPAKLRGLILGSCAAGNLGNIFLIIIPATCKEKGSPFGVPDVCQTYGLAYASLSMAIGAIFLWLIVYNIVRVASNMTDGDDGTRTNETKSLISGRSTDSVSEQNCPISGDYTNDYTFPLVSNFGEPSTETKVSMSKRARNFLSSIPEIVDFKKLLAPSTIGVIVGFIIGGTPLIRKAIIGEDAPLRVLHESADLLGGGAIPSVALIMGANLINGLHGSGVHSSIIIGVIVVRYILLPLLGTAVVKAAVRLGFVPPDPLYQFVLLLQYAVPPAMNIGTITQLFGVGEKECSVIFIWMYALASVAVTVWSAFFMWSVT